METTQFEFFNTLIKESFYKMNPNEEIPNFSECEGSHEPKMELIAQKVRKYLLNRQIYNMNALWEVIVNSQRNYAYDKFHDILNELIRFRERQASDFELIAFLSSNPSWHNVQMITDQNIIYENLSVKDWIHILNITPNQNNLRNNSTQTDFPLPCDKNDIASQTDIMNSNKIGVQTQVEIKKQNNQMICRKVSSNENVSQFSNKNMSTSIEKNSKINMNANKQIKKNFVKKKSNNIYNVETKNYFEKLTPSDDNKTTKSLVYKNYNEATKSKKLQNNRATIGIFKQEKYQIRRGKSTKHSPIPFESQIQVKKSESEHNKFISAGEKDCNKKYIDSPQKSVIWQARKNNTRTQKQTSKFDSTQKKPIVSNKWLNKSDKFRQNHRVIYDSNSKDSNTTNYSPALKRRKWLEKNKTKNQFSRIRNPNNAFLENNFVNQHNMRNLPKCPENFPMNKRLRREIFSMISSIFSLYMRRKFSSNVKFI